MIKTFPLKRNFLATREEKNLFRKKRFLPRKSPQIPQESPGPKTLFGIFPKTESADEGVGGARRGRKKSAEIRSSRGPRRGAWGHEGRGAPAHAAAPCKISLFRGAGGARRGAPGARSPRGFEKSEKVRSTWGPLQPSRRRRGVREVANVKRSREREENFSARKVYRRFYEK